MLDQSSPNLLSIPEGLRTRFAPSPTGYLHLGHVCSAIYVWGIAQTRSAQVLLRIEDHDRQRCRPEFTAAIRDDLSWLGFTWDKLSIQSEHLDRYESITSRADVYACDCSRKDIQTRQSRRELELHYDGHCRTRQLPQAGNGLRIPLPADSLSFHDLLQGPQTQTPAEQCGDLLLRERSGSWTYNFAVTIDDALEGIDLIIRGMDLLQACGRQRLLAQVLGVHSPQLLWHHPLIHDEQGQKLSKRYGSTAIRTLKASGVRAQDVLGLAAQAVGLLDRARPLEVRELGVLFNAGI